MKGGPCLLIQTFLLASSITSPYLALTLVRHDGEALISCGLDLRAVEHVGMGRVPLGVPTFEDHVSTLRRLGSNN